MRHGAEGEGEVSECISGCRVKGQHAEECDGDTCHGCRPRPADTGNLCAWCWRLLCDDVATHPALIAHLRELGEPHAQNKPLTSDTFGRGDPAESSVLPSEWEYADEIQSTLASWAQVVTEEHPNRPMRGPNAAPWHGDVVAWITPHLEWAAGQEWAGEMARELRRDISTGRVRWPMPEDVEPPRSAGVACPRCDELSLTYTPPRAYRQPFIVACSNPECARVFSEDEWERFKALILTRKGAA